jgi:hypothetical protein
VSPLLLVVFVKQNFPIDVKYLEHSNSWCCYTIYAMRVFFQQETAVDWLLDEAVRLPLHL